MCLFYILAICVGILGGLLFLWLRLEVGVCLTILLAFSFGARISVLFEYYLVQVVSTILMLYGILNIFDVLVVFAFSLKIGIFPFVS